MSKRVDVFFSLQSDYCYLLLNRLMNLDRRAHVVIRPVLPGLIRNADAYKDRGQMEVDYFAVDTQRVADFLGMPYRYPDPSPVEFEEGSLWVAAREQSRIDRLYHLFTAACLGGKGLAFLDQVLHLIWDGRGVDWTAGSHLDDAVRAAGLDPDELRNVSATDVAKTLEKNDQAMQQAGHWGVPLMVYKGEPFYGQDRFDHLLWRMGQ